MEPALLAAQGIEKSYYKGTIEIPVLKGVDLEVDRGEFVCIVGASGSGKSTLLHLLGTLDDPDAGSILLSGRRIDRRPPRERDRLRNRTFGFIFQFYHLLPEFNTLENVLVPQMIRHTALGFWRRGKAQRERAARLLDQVGLTARATHKPSELSGGEMQRAAIARALMAEPEILLADEPTGNLDAETGQEILALLRSLNEQHDLTIIMVTHDAAIAAGANRTIRLREGRVEELAGPPGATGSRPASGGRHAVFGAVRSPSYPAPTAIVD